MYLKTKEVAKIFGCTQRNIALMVKTGKLKPVNNHKEFFLFDAYEIELLNFKRNSNENK